MTAIDRYVMRIFARNLMGSLTSFTCLYLMVEFFAKIDDFLEHGAPFRLFLPYFFGILPSILSETAPLAVLLAMFLTLAKLSHTRELVALRAGGVRPMRVCRPLLATVLALSLTILVAGEFVSPRAALMANRILEQKVKGKPLVNMKRDNLWLREGNSFVHIVLADPEQKMLQGVSVFTVDDRFRVLARTDAPTSLFRDHQWILKNASTRFFHPTTAFQPAKSLPGDIHLELGLTPENYRLSQDSLDYMSIRDLHRLSGALEKSAADAKQVKTDFHTRLATPFNSLVLGILAIPFALRGPRSGGLGPSLTLTIIIGLSVYFGQALFQVFGYGGLLPPALAAWLANLLFGGLGLLLLSARKK